MLTGRLKTPVFGYDGVFPGPRIELNQGTPAVVRQRNHLPAVGPFGQPNKTSTHLHGSASLPEFDGYASDVTAPGEFKDYHYPNFQPARTLWYHDHGVHWTAQQAYGGLVAMYLLHDKEESDLLPTGDFDIPLVVNDAMFAADGSLAYDDNSHSGLWGDVILVNGRPVAEDEGPAAHLPVPRPGLLDLPLVQLAAEQRDAAAGGGHRRWADAQGRGRAVHAPRRRRALRVRDRLLQGPGRHQAHRAAQRLEQEQPRLRASPAR